MTDQAPEQQTADTEAEHIRSVDELGAKVDKLAAMVEGLFKGDDSPKDSPGSAPGSAGPDPASVGEQVQAELAKVRQAEQDQARAKGDADWRKTVDDAVKRIPETRPREEISPVRRLAQRVLGAGEFER